MIRVSIGTLARAGLLNIKLLAEPTTAYLLQYSESGCIANCLFCSQSSRSRSSRDTLARVVWPVQRLENVVDRLSTFVRVCVQSVLKRGFVDELAQVISLLRERFRGPISVAVTPLSDRELAKLIDAGIESVGIGLDAASPRVFEAVEKPFTWGTYIDFVKRCVDHLGDRVWVHLVVGLGESVDEAIEAMKLIRSLGAHTALFNYVHVPGTPRLPGVDLYTYRLLQVARLLIEEGYDPKQFIEASPRPRFRRRPPIDPINALLTSGCPGCNRPFYNESPRGPIYNYPSRQLLERDLEVVERQLAEIGAI